MESGSPAPVLDELDRVRAAAAQRSRAAAWLELRSAFVLAVFLGIALLSTAREPHGTGPFLIPGLVMPAMLLTSGLEQGARERLGARLGAGLVSWLPLLAVGALFLLLVFLRGRYPWWVAVVCLVGGFAVSAVRPVARLLRTRRDAGDTDPWRSGPLSDAARTVTTLAGCIVGAATAVLPLPEVHVVVALPLLVLAAALGSARWADWGTAAVGQEWSRIHWIAWGIALAIIAAAAILSSAADLTLGLSIGLGAGIAAVMALSSFLPRR